ncbi:MAG: mechanosensitive ion channel domain-containing protein [Ignavibacteria bacterium]
MSDFLNTELLKTETFIITVWNLLNVVIIFFAAGILIKVISTVLKKSMLSKDKMDGRHQSIIQLIRYVIWIIAVSMCLKVLHVDVTFLIASSAALLVGVGLGLQNVFKDFISGIIILIEGTVKVEDIVEVEGIVLKVKEIALRTSKVVSREDKVMIIPNHKFIEENVTNWTHNNTPTRFILPVSVDYSSDTRLVEKTLHDCAMKHKDVIKEGRHEPYIRFTDFGDSALLFEIIFWSNNLFRIESTKSDIRFDISDAFRANKIIIPFPQRMVHLPKEKSEEE